MSELQKARAAVEARPMWMPWLYMITLVTMTLTGFGQMPIYKRYYLSDIPGLGWLADFYLTRYAHYIGASVLLALVFYAGFDFLLLQRKRLRLTTTGDLRAALLAGIVVSGAFIVIKNFPHVHCSESFIIGLDLFHVGAVMGFLLTSMLCRLMKQRWTTAS
jgi:xanthine/uracil/vitamin C permease (AzgA family)